MDNQNKKINWKKIGKIVLNVFFYTLIGLLLIFSITNLTRKDKTEVASIFGSGYCTVLSESMAGKKKDSFTSKDLILVRKVTDRNRDRLLSKKVSVGKIITFKGDVNGQEALITHRVVDIITNADGSINYFITQGDYNAIQYGEYVKEKGDISACEVVSPSDVRGIYTGKMKGLGGAMKFLQTPNGFLLCVVLPMILFFIAMLLILVLNIISVRKAKTEEQHAADIEALKEEQARMLEEEKARIRAELLAEQQKQAEAEAPAEEKQE